MTLSDQCDAQNTLQARRTKNPRCAMVIQRHTYRGEGKGTEGMAMRVARRRAGAAAEGLFPSTRHSSMRSGATAAALERRLRVSGGSAPAPQRHRIRTGRRGQDAAPLAAVRSNGGAVRPLEHAAIFSCHGEAGRRGGGAWRPRALVSSGGGGSRKAKGRVLKGWAGASLLQANDRDR